MNVRTGVRVSAAAVHAPPTRAGLPISPRVRASSELLPAMIAPTLSSRMQLAGAVFAINGALISWLNGPECVERGHRRRTS